MRHATRLLGGLALLVGLTATAHAQPFDVTFQVDMNAAIDNCAFTPGTDNAAVRGSFNDWGNGGDGPLDAYYLVDDGSGADATSGDGIYTGTFAVEASEDSDTSTDGLQIAYKFYGSSTATDYEGGDNRTETITMDTTLDPVAFGKTFSDQCGATIQTYDVTFQVDMEVQELRGTFDPDNGDVVTVAGEFNGWSTPADTLVQDFFDPNLYAKTLQVDLTIGEPSAPHKFVIGTFGDAAPGGWESIADQRITVDGSEPDPDSDGRPDVTVSRFFNNTDFSGILREDAAIVIAVDMRPAFYYLADSTGFPGADEVTEVTSVYANGPVMASADGNNFNGGWLDWDMNGLGSQNSRQLFDDGLRGDAVAGDSVFSRRFIFPAGTELQAVGKFSVNSFDNEGGFGVNQTFVLGSGPDSPASSVDFVFGAVVRTDDATGDLYIDDANGPDDFPHYDPYIITDNTVDPPTAMAVRRGGDNTDVSVTDTGVPATIATLEANYPNPFASRTTFEYANPAAQHVTLAVYDITGRRVALLVDEVQASSTYQVEFDASELAAGVYVYRLVAGDETITRRMVVVR